MRKKLLFSGLLTLALSLAGLTQATAGIYLSKRIFDTDIHAMKNGDSKVIIMGSTQIIGNYFMTWGENGLSMALDGAKVQWTTDEGATTNDTTAINIPQCQFILTCVDEENHGYTLQTIEGTYVGYDESGASFIYGGEEAASVWTVPVSLEMTVNFADNYLTDASLSEVVRFVTSTGNFINCNGPALRNGTGGWSIVAVYEGVSKDNIEYNVVINGLDGSFDYDDMTYYNGDVIYVDEAIDPEQIVVEQFEDYTATLTVVGTTITVTYAYDGYYVHIDGGVGSVSYAGATYADGESFVPQGDFDESLLGVADVEGYVRYVEIKGHDIYVTYYEDKYRAHITTQSAIAAMQPGDEKRILVGNSNVNSNYWLGYAEGPVGAYRFSDGTDRVALDTRYHFILAATEYGYTLRTASEGLYLTCTDDNAVVWTEEPYEWMIPALTTDDLSYDDTWTISDLDSLVRFDAGGLYLNCQANAASIKMASGTGGYSFWHVFEITEDKHVSYTVTVTGAEGSVVYDGKTYGNGDVIELSDRIDQNLLSATDVPNYTATLTVTDGAICVSYTFQGYTVTIIGGVGSVSYDGQVCADGEVILPGETFDQSLLSAEDVPGYISAIEVGDHQVTVTYYEDKYQTTFLTWTDISAMEPGTEKRVIMGNSCTTSNYWLGYADGAPVGAYRYFEDILPATLDEHYHFILAATEYGYTIRTAGENLYIGCDDYNQVSWTAEPFEWNIPQLAEGDVSLDYTSTIVGLDSLIRFDYDGMFLNCQSAVSGLKMAAGKGGWSFWHLLELSPKGADAIQPVLFDEQKAIIFDLQGRQVTDDKLQPGIYIKKGKKFIAK